MLISFGKSLESNSQIPDQEFLSKAWNTRSQSITKEMKSKLPNLEWRGKPPETEATIVTRNGIHETSFRKVKLCGERLKPCVVSLMLLFKNAHCCWVPFESWLSECINLFLVTFYQSRSAKIKKVINYTVKEKQDIVTTK